MEPLDETIAFLVQHATFDEVYEFLAARRAVREMVAGENAPASAPTARLRDTVPDLLCGPPEGSWDPVPVQVVSP